MGRFTKVSQSTFEEIQLEAGLILKNFNPDTSDDVKDEDIVCATTGGIEITCKPSFVDYGADIDNVPNNMKEFMEIDGWDCSISFTALNASVEAIKMALGAAELSNTMDSEIAAPRNDIKEGDFSDIWWVGDRADGGYVACKLINAMSTEGLTLKTSKKGKGQLSCTLKGHVSIDAQDVVPMEFYVMAGAYEA